MQARGTYKCQAVAKQLASGLFMGLIFGFLDNFGLFCGSQACEKNFDQAMDKNMARLKFGEDGDRRNWTTSAS